MDDRQNMAVNTEDQEFMEVSLLDLAVILVAQRWFIAKVTTAFAVAAIIYALLATPIYKSTIQIMPPASGGSSGAMATLAASGMGDLVATCSSPLSRNQTFGRHLGEGMSVEEAAAVSRGVAEGAKSARAILDLATAHGVEMPITAGIVAVVEGAATVTEVNDALLARPRSLRTYTMSYKNYRFDNCIVSFVIAKALIENLFVHRRHVFSRRRSFHLYFQKF